MTKRKHQKTGNSSKATKAFAKPGNTIGTLEYTISKAEQKRALNPPVDNSLVENLHGYRVSDPFRQLEDLKSAETNAWVARQNDRFAEYTKSSQAFFDSTIDFMTKAQPQGMTESMPSRITDNLYVCRRRNEGEDRFSVYLKDKPDFDAPARLFLDPLKIDPTGKTNIGALSFSKDGKLAAYSLSVGGSDKNSIHFINVETGEHLPLSYPDSTSWRNGVKWSEDGKSFTYGRDVADLEKSTQTLRHVLGTDPADDKIIYSPETAETSTGVYRVKRDMTDKNGDYEFAYEQAKDYSTNRVLMRRFGSDAAFEEIFPFGNGTLSPIAEINGKIYATTTYDAPRGKLICFDPARPQPQNWQTVIAQPEKDLLNSTWAWQGKIFASYSHDTADKITLHDLDGKQTGEMPLPAMSSASIGNFHPDNTTCMLSVSNFQEDGAIYTYDVTDNSISLHRASRRPIDLKDCVVERIHATSKDGTLVPMTVIRHPDTKLDGTAATILYGYGGFQVPLEPGFSTGLARWVRAGGIYVQANLRGGGEFGEDWYNQGRRENKQNVFDDFAACAEYLIANKYTIPARLGIQGGSNGGLLTLATGLQRPELFGAILSHVPVADMNRFHIGSHYGYSWKGDYGDPDVKKDFDVAIKYSPYHNVRKGMQHPPLLINTDAHDDRVLPWHGYKMAALLQAREAKGSVTMIRTATSGGHGGGGSLKLAFESTATSYAFLERALGPIDQKAYKASLKSKATIQAPRKR